MRYEIFNRYIKAYGRKDLRLSLTEPLPKGYELQETREFGMFKVRVYRNEAEIELVEVLRRL